jgi:hypothetical protein
MLGERSGLSVEQGRGDLQQDGALLPQLPERRMLSALPFAAGDGGSFVLHGTFEPGDRIQDTARLVDEYLIAQRWGIEVRREPLPERSRVHGIKSSATV